MDYIILNTPSKSYNVVYFQQKKTPARNLKHALVVA